MLGVGESRRNGPARKGIVGSVQKRVHKQPGTAARKRRPGVGPEAGVVPENSHGRDRRRSSAARESRSRREAFVDFPSMV